MVFNQLWYQPHGCHHVVGVLLSLGLWFQFPRKGYSLKQKGWRMMQGNGGWWRKEEKVEQQGESKMVWRSPSWAEGGEGRHKMAEGQ